MSMNKVLLIGNVGSDPAVMISKNDLTIANFTLATNEFGKKDDEGKRKKQTEWHSVSAFGKIAQLIEKYVKKGDQLYIEGRLETQSYEDKDGITRRRTQIVTSSMQFLTSKKGKEENGNENV